MKLKTLLFELGSWQIDESMEEAALMDFEVVYEAQGLPFNIESVEYDQRAGLVILKS